MRTATASSRLGAWYASHARDLPWRRGHEPYHILLSEFLLQQTRIETALPYYQRFLDRFPDLESLAAAPVEEVLRLWSGLGYYRRARNLHATARRIVEEHGGIVPDDPGLLERLPGIGPYAAGAVASIAFDRPAAAVDGNQTRVIGRLLGMRTTASHGARARIASWANELVGRASPRMMNQALMDLGSQVCFPRTPRCELCPLSRGCRARTGMNRQRGTPKAAVPTEDWEASLHVDGRRLWLAAPRGRGLLADLWLPPLRRSRRRSVRGDPLVVFTHRRWRIRWLRAAGRPEGPGLWVTRRQLTGLAHGRLTVLAFEAAGLGPSVHPLK